jgi:cellulose synthase operon protein C
MTRIALTAFFLVCAATQAEAQTPAAPAPEELLALTFYYQQQDEASARSELQRLQILYPEWQPPDDLARLTQAEPGPEIDTIYRQIGAGQLAEARSTILATQAAFPEWVPPPEMTSLLDTSEGQILLDDALAEGDLARALTLAGQRPGLLRCDRINNAWRIAEAQEEAGQTSEALGTYRAVISACVNPPDIIATLEKSSAVASTAELQGLFSQVLARFPDLAESLSPVQARLTGQDAATAASPPVSSDTAAAASPASPPPVAASRPSTSPQAAGAAESSTVPRAPQSAAPRTSAGSGTAIYQQAWQTYNLDRPMEAIAQFQTALQGRLDATQRRDAQYGIALSYLKMGMSDNAASMAAATDLTRQQRVDVERQILDQRGVAAYNRREYRRAIEFFDALQELTGSLRRDLDTLRAYSYLNSGQRDRARQEFTRLHRELATAETRRGLAALE